MTTPTVRRLLKRYDALTARRSTWNSLYSDLVDYLMPDRGPFTGEITPGTDRSLRQFDSTPPDALTRMVSALHGMMVNPATKWFKPSLSGVPKDVKENAETQNWLGEVSEITLEAYGNSNQALQMHEHLYDVGGLGTGVLFQEEDEKQPGEVNFSAFPLSTCFIAEDASGRVDTLYRLFKHTARQALQKWPGKLSEKITKAAVNNPEEEYQFLHVVEEREKWDKRYTATNPKVRPWACYYVEYEQKRLVVESGYHEIPFCAPRWTKASGEIYGRSQAITNIADIRMLNRVQESFITSVELATEPAYQAPVGFFLYEPVRIPNYINYYRPGMTDRGLEPLPDGGNLPATDAYIQRLQEKIETHFFVDILTTREGPQMTATEVLQRLQERMQLLGPVLFRLQNELLKPMIMRTYGILKRAGRIPNLPSVLVPYEKNLIIEYTSPIARAQRMEEAQSIMQLLEFLSPLLGIDPDVVAMLNTEEMLRGLVRILGVPQQMIYVGTKLKERKEQLRESRKGAVELQEGKELAEIVSKVSDATQKAA